MRNLFFMLSFFALCSAMVSCREEQRQEVTPWGSVVGDDTVSSSQVFGLGDIIGNGELIVLTLSGPETYYDYRGRGMGLQYLLCEKFAQRIGVSMRVEVCKDTAEMVSRLRRGDADVIAYQLPKTIKGVRFAGVEMDSAKTAWAVQQDSKELADSLDRWFKPAMIAEVRQLESFYLSTRSVRRRVFSPMLNRAGGVISYYDRYFQQYAPLARWDWRLMAAQCYQESTFDPQAKSWAGACGLMQIMPSTATHLGLPHSQLFDPENNIAAAAKYIRELDGLFRDVPDHERVNFVLASYNGGHFHIRDAMALARKHGRNDKRWGDVQEFVLKLSSPAYYNDAVVRYGYMRGSETVDYVSRINDRWRQYRGVAGGGRMGAPYAPERSRRSGRWQI
jgi:membrane-bound lytic murein transglycosylase F